MPENTSVERVLLSVDKNTSFVLLSLSNFDECQGGVPSVGQKLKVITTVREEYSASMDYSPSINVTEVTHGKFREIIPTEVKGLFAYLLDKEGYFVKGET